MICATGPDGTHVAIKEDKNEKQRIFRIDLPWFLQIL